MSIVDVAYYGREQTKVKHEMLRRYLAPAARIIGSFADCFVYVDCCSGPWNSTTEDLSDTSFSIAINELRDARAFLQQRNRNVEFRCLFFEENQTAFAKLQHFCDSVNDIRVQPVQGDFTEKVEDILTFVRNKRNSFPFFFIDPTGWSPLAISKIRPLLQYKRSEVLINFMTSHIKRFLESSDFATKFGPDYMRKVMGLSGQDRDDLSAYSFADEIRRFYRHTCTSVVINPLRDQTHFHLIYGTQSPKGVEKFKEAEKSCFGFMQAVRIDAQQRQRPEDTQGHLFDDLAPDKDRYIQHLRRHYLEQAFKAVETEARRHPLTEDQAWGIASRFPLVWKSDVRAWVQAHAV